jgi:hypothetical protein
LFVYVGWQTFGGCQFDEWVFKGMLEKRKQACIQAVEAKCLQTIATRLATQNAQKSLGFYPKLFNNNENKWLRKHL